MSPEDAPGETAVSLLDRLAPPFAAAGGGRVAARRTAHHAVPEALSQRLADQAALSGQLPDSPLVAAWLVVLRHWLGSDGADAGEIVGDAAEPRSLHCAMRSGQSAADWLAELDGRRGAPAGRTACAGSPPFTSLWQRTPGADSRPAAPPGAALVLGLAQAPQPALFADFDATLTTAAEVELLLQATLHAAQDLLAQPAQPADRISPLEPGQRKQPHDGAAPSPPPARDPALTVHGQFARQAAERGDAVALSWQGQSLSYRELAHQAAAMAGELRAAGIAPGDTVAVALERAPRAIIALLA
ncbi:MAG TPA: AMP-binding protein, partial [Ideonella sp.]|nr:AMP-binding protein [Ideonella sp.]